MYVPLLTEHKKGKEAQPESIAFDLDLQEANWI